MKKLHLFKGLSLILVLIFIFIAYVYLEERSKTCFKTDELNNIKNLSSNEVKKVSSTSKVLKQLNKDKNICILNIKKDKNNSLVKISTNNTLDNFKRTLNRLYKIPSFKNIKELHIKGVKGEKNNNINTYLEVEFYPEFT